MPNLSNVFNKPVEKEWTKKLWSVLMLKSRIDVRPLPKKVCQKKSLLDFPRVSFLSTQTTDWKWKWRWTLLKRFHTAAVQSCLNSFLSSDNFRGSKWPFTPQFERFHKSCVRKNKSFLCWVWDSIFTEQEELYPSKRICFAEKLPITFSSGSQNQKSETEQNGGRSSTVRSRTRTLSPFY